MKQLDANRAFRARFRSGAILVGTFVKTPGWEVVEILASSGFDFLVVAVSGAARRYGVTAMTTVSDAAEAPALRVGGMTAFIVSTDQAMLRRAARDAVRSFRMTA